MPEGYDFSGWVSIYNAEDAEDGMVVRSGAFKYDDGKEVPLIWMHQHNDPEMTIGRALLEERPEGLYAYGYLNRGSKALAAREALDHGDVKSLSIWANNLSKSGRDVLRGVTREVSLVLSGGDPGATIESVVARGIPMGIEEDEGIIYTGRELFIPGGNVEMNEHIERASSNDKDEEEEDKKSDKSIGEILNTLNDDQKIAVAVLLENANKKKTEDSDEDEEETEVKRNVFENDDNNGTEYLSRSAQADILAKGEECGSFKKALKAYMEENGVISRAVPMTGMTGPDPALANYPGTDTPYDYGFRDPEMLFPDYRSLNNPPEWISRDMGWVSVVMGGVHHTPFSRIRSVFADITEDEARAKGYMKTKLKKDEVFTLLKRTTDPQTIYKRQKLDRDDIISITDFDVVAWIRAEMRVMLNEEIARAILIGDGRANSSNDKIKEDHIRPIINEAPLFNIQHAVPYDSSVSADVNTKAVINEAVRARKDYKGSGNPIFFTTEDYLTEMLLLEDGIGHKLYKSEAEVATAIRASRIVTVEPMEGQKVTVNGAEKDLIGVLVNLADYNVGTDKGGEVSLFDDFDIDYNRYTYLIETRMSGALTKPYSAITLYKETA